MNYAKRFFMVAGVVAVAVLAGSLAAPKSTHALVATLVEVANTPANPVPVQEVIHASSQIVDLQCSAPSEKPAGPCISISSAGGNGGAFTVPAGQSLVMTTIEVSGITVGSSTSVQMDQGLPGASFLNVRESFTLPTTAPVAQLQYPTGIVVASGYQVGFDLFGNQFGIGDSVSVRVVGYLTAN